MPAFGNVRQIMLKKKRGTKCPFLSKYIRLALAKGTKDDFVESETIFQEYAAAVAIWTDGDSLRGQTKYLMKKTAFLKQFKKQVMAYADWVVQPAVRAGKKRGYSGIRIQRPRRQPTVEFGGRIMLERIQHYMSLNPKPQPPIEVHKVLTDPRGAGNCAFASRDIEKGEIICEYEGEKIDSKEVRQREEMYEREDRPCTLMVIESAGHQIA
ncbi:hypothetical protein ACROYT_G030706 [Oculina patagonica]